MEYPVEFAPEACDEIDDAYNWIANESPAGAQRWFNGLMDAIRSLHEDPERCPVAPENDAFDEEIRQLLYGKRQHAYRILFNINGPVVQILHVRHGARRHLGETTND